MVFIKIRKRKNDIFFFICTNLCDITPLLFYLKILQTDLYGKNFNK